MTRTLTPLVGIGLLATAALIGGCGSVDKAGGEPPPHPRVLRLANFNPTPAELEPYAREVARLSKGRLQIECANDWRKDHPRGEAGVIEDVRTGKVDLGWVGARAFKPKGIAAFDPLIAPFEVTNYATEEKVLRSPVAAEMLGEVDKAGVHGV